MRRYYLDDLGWYQFEMLIQSLLKAICGLSIESWGQSSDFGRDAYSSHPLSFPLTSENVGPFLFQVKFVENANAAGAKPDPLLINAVRNEIALIRERKKTNKWEALRYYTLVTNVPVSANLRNQIIGLLTKELPNTEIITWGALDIENLLDQNPSIRRSFPQLLSLRELDLLIETALGKEGRERSSSAIEEARAIIPVFVPTNVYHLCWEILSKHHFAVLDGPPEVGKTAIAWMISITQVSNGWEALVCNKPDNFFQFYQKDSKQIFIADDAFGRTEYDVALGREWEKDLVKVLNRIDKNHWLIWTSRKHILEFALRQMDLQGKAEFFPEPAEVLVDAGKLSHEEKALILYRHAKAANLEADAKIILKKNARMITIDRYFTPERIRNFVQVVLPDLVVSMNGGNLSQELIAGEIKRAIARPTDRMQKSFRLLSDPHKYILISLLSASGNVTVESLKKNFDVRFGTKLSSGKFQEFLDDLSESFIHIKKKKDVEW